jgi:hypothetical protein
MSSVEADPPGRRDHGSSGHDTSGAGDHGSSGRDTSGASGHGHDSHGSSSAGPGGATLNLAAMRRRWRRDFLARLYDRVDGSISEFVNGYELGSGLGLEESEAGKIFEYLEEKGWVMVDDHRAGTIRMTALGIDEVEAGA